MPKRIGKRRFAVLKAAAGGYGLGEAVGQAGELEVWKGERYGVSFFWPVALPEDVKPLMGQAWAQESQSYFHSELIYDLEEDGRTIKLRHGGQECLVFELLEEGARDETS